MRLSSPARLVAAAAAVGVTTIGLDFLWLGAIAGPFYRRSLGPLLRDPPQLVAAGLFYSLYVATTVGHAVVPATGVRAAAGRGARLGLVVYAAYELTNWAMIRDWPLALVPVDIGWGVALTAIASASGRWALERSGGRSGTAP
jgi:uncharacterized membrane protein